MPVSIFLLGVLAITAQTSFLREVLATFRGGELTIGAALFFWLLWTSVGCGILGKSAERITHPDRWFHALMPWYGVLGYAGTRAIGALPFLAGLTPGEHVPYDLQLFAVCLAFLPFNVLGGFLFVLGAKTIRYKNSPSPGRAYTIEALGSASAGLIISLVLVLLLPNHGIALFCPIIGIPAGAFLTFRNGSFRDVSGVLLSVAVFAALSIGTAGIADYSSTGQTVLEVQDTKYGRLRVTSQGEQITFYSDASTLFSAPDAETSEYAVHLPMLVAENPRRVLVLGGGPGGIIDEAVKYSSVERIVCVELDPGLFELAGRHLREDWTEDPRVETVVADGRAYLEKANERFDVIIMNMPEPLSGVANRYYTREFFRLVSSRLSSAGILGFSLFGDENYVSDELALYLSSVRATLSDAFPAVVALPGARCRFLAGNSSGMFDNLDWELLSARREERGIETSFVRDYYLHDTLAPFRMDFIREALDAVEEPQVNTDTKPSGYFIRTLFQGDLDNSHITDVLKPLSSTHLLWLFMLAVIALVLLAVIIPGAGSSGRAIGAAIVSVGLTEISLEVLAIMAYQSVFGFLYGRIALLIGSYMAGLALGGWRGTRLIERNHTGIQYLATVQTGIMVLPLLWAGILWLHSLFPGSIPFLEQGFYLLTFLAGLAGGFQFPVADALYRRARSSGVPGLGAVYGLDLAGSSVGALAAASLIIPALGMFPALAFLAVLNGITAGALWAKRGV